MAWWRTALAAGVLASVSLGVSSHAGAGEPTQSPMDRLRAAATAADDKDCPKALEIILPLIDAPAEKVLRPDIAALAYAIAAGCEIGTDRDRAYAYAVHGTTLAGATPEVWKMRFALELDAKQNEAAVATVELLAASRPEVLNAMPYRWMAQLQRTVTAGKEAALRERLLKVLAADAYRPEEPFASNDYYRVEYAHILADKGDLAGAKALVLKLNSPDAIERASVDARLRTAFSSDPDLRSLVERRLVSDRAILAAHKDLLGAVVETASDLRLIGRYQEALALINSVGARIDDPSAFSDRDDRLPWWSDVRARTLLALGRYDEAVAVYRKAAAGKEQGSRDVSQVINLAEYQNATGHGADALETLEAFAEPGRGVSPYGEMEMRFARACALALTHRAGDGAADLDFMRAHELDHPRALFDTLACMGDLDGAAAAMIRRLNDPARREDALLQLADYDAPPAALAADPVTSRLDAIKHRPDVAAAIARAGGLRRFNIQPAESLGPPARGVSVPPHHRQAWARS